MTELTSADTPTEQKLKGGSPGCSPKSAELTSADIAVIYGWLMDDGSKPMRYVTHPDSKFRFNSWVLYYDANRIAYMATKPPTNHRSVRVPRMYEAALPRDQRMLVKCFLKENDYL